MNISKKLLITFFQLCLLSPAFAELPVGLNEQSIRTAAVNSFPEYLNLLTIPNDSIANVEGIKLNANQLESLFQTEASPLNSLQTTASLSSWLSTLLIRQRKPSSFIFILMGNPLFPLSGGSRILGNQF